MRYAVLLNEGLQSVDSDHHKKMEIDDWLRENCGFNTDHTWDAKAGNSTNTHHSYMMLYAHFSHVDGGWHSGNRSSLYGVAFEREEDAVAFKLVWGV